MNGDNIVLDRIKVLNVINMLQPVSMSYLSRALKKSIMPDILSTIIEELLKVGFISFEKRNYRVTRRGISFNLSRESKTLRDVSRMKYLLGTSKAKGR